MHPLDIAYLFCLSLGGMYMLLTLLMGGISHAAGHIGDALHLPHLNGHHVGDAHAGHIGHGHAGHGHAGHHGHIGHHEHGHHHHGDHHSDHSGEDSGSKFHILAFLSPTLIAGFLLGFGGLGAIGRFGLNVPLMTSLIPAAIGGMTMWTASYLFISRVFGRAGGTSHNRREMLAGTRAQVTAPIAGSQPGMVAYTASGSRQSLRAITEDDEPIPVGAAVRIRKVEENTAYVIRID